MNNVKAFVNGIPVTIYGYGYNKDGQRVASCYVPELGIKQDYRLDQIEVRNAEN